MAAETRTGSRPRWLWAAPNGWHAGIDLGDTALPRFADAAEGGTWFPDEIGYEVGYVTVLRIVPGHPRVEPGVAETHVVGPQHPDDENGGEAGESHENSVDNPLFLDQAAEQDSEARDAHQGHERGRRELPGVVTGVQPRLVRTAGEPAGAYVGCSKERVQKPSL